MANVLDATGLTTSTRTELIAYFTAQLQAIYGSDINLDSDTPDGQWVNIMTQSILDIEDLLTQIYNTFDPDNAIGNVLDQRVAINGIQRQAGTYTTTNITVVTSQSVNLYGLDQEDQEIYTVADNAGNKWFLETTELGLGPGSDSLTFRAETPGENLTIPNTITVQITIVLGVTSVNNPTTYLILGTNEESDANLKVRRQKSVSLASQGYLAGLLAALENVPGVTSAFVYENLTNETNSDGVPGHSIWVVLAESGAAPVDIATAIYDKRNAGCGMFGDESYTLTQVDGSPFTLYWDEVVQANLFIYFMATSLNGTTQPNIEAIVAGLPAIFNPAVNEEVNINGLATLVQQIDPNTLVTGAGFSTGIDQEIAFSGVAASGTFQISYNGNLSASINWNDAIGTIQSKVQAITGLTDCLVTGSIVSQFLTFDLTDVIPISALLFVTQSTLLTGGAVAINFMYDENYSNTLLPLSKINQFVVSSENIIIAPMQLNPIASTVAHTQTQQMTGLGGYGTLLYSISVNNSGGSINSATGLYTAGATPNVIDTILVVDSLGNSGIASVSVT